MNKTILSALTVCVAMFFSGAASAITDSGNSLALDIVSAKAPAEKAQIIKNSIGTLYYFRYLKITDMKDGMTNGNRAVFISAVEPSSDMIVEFTVIKTVSLKVLDNDPKTKVGDCIGATGRVESIGKKGPNTFVLNPIIVNHKDKDRPVRGKELLYEIDPNARMGTDTSSGKIIKIPAK